MRNDIGREAGLPIRVGPGRHHRFTDRRMLDQRDFDLAGVHPVPAHLHLVIPPPEDLEAAVGLQPSDVSRTVSVHLRVGGVGEEHRAGEVRLTPVSRGEMAAPHDDLTGLAGGHRMPGVVEEHDLDTIERVAGRNSPGGQGRVLVDAVRGDAAGFARAVARDENAVRAKMPAEPLDVLPVEGLAAEPHDPDRRKRTSGPRLATRWRIVVTTAHRTEIFS